MKTKLFFYLVVSVALMQALASGGMAQSPTPQTIRFGAALSLSGPYSNLGHQKPGMKLLLRILIGPEAYLLKNMGRRFLSK